MEKYACENSSPFTKYNSLTITKKMVIPAGTYSYTDDFQTILLYERR